MLVECLDSHGRVSWRERLVLGDGRRSITIGRSLDADVTLDDDHAAVLHAQVEISPDGTLRVSDFGSLNGIVIAGERVRGARGLALPGRELQIGRTRLRLRSSSEQLVPEKLDQHGAGSLLANPMLLAGIAMVAAAAQTIYGGWLGAPRDLTASVLSMVAASGALVAAWVGVWALLSRVMQGEWRWLSHIAICLGVAVVYRAADAVFDLGTFVLALPRWSLLGGLTAAIALGAALYLHLRHASTLAVRHAALLASLAPALLGGGYTLLMSRYDRLNVNRIEAAMRIYPPSLRLRGAGTIDDFYKSAAELRRTTDKHRQTMQAEDPERDDDPLPKR